MCILTGPRSCQSARRAASGYFATVASAVATFKNAALSAGHAGVGAPVPLGWAALMTVGFTLAIVLAAGAVVSRRRRDGTA